MDLNNNYPTIAALPNNTNNNKNYNKNNNNSNSSNGVPNIVPCSAAVSAQLIKQLEVVNQAIQALHAAISPHWIHHKAIELLIKCISNVLDNPGVEKYRQIPVGHENFKKKIGILTGTVRVLRACGWRTLEMLDSTKQVESNLYLDDLNRNTTVLQHAKDLLSMELDELTCKILDKEAKEQGGQVNKLTREQLAAVYESKLTKKKNKANTISQTDESKSPDPNIALFLPPPQEQAKGRIRDFSKHNPGPAAESKAPAQPYDPSTYPGQIPHINATNERANEQIKQLYNENKHVGPAHNLDELERRKIMTLDDIDWTNELIEIGKQTLLHTNAFRQSQGLHALNWDLNMCLIGMKHSKNMALGISPFGHEHFDKRVAAFPFAYQSAAENVAMNSGLIDTAKRAVEGWIDSPGHRKNMLGTFNRCGIGVYKNAQGLYYYTQLLALV
jgi:uncharacterized protein YkwD